MQRRGLGVRGNQPLDEPLLALNDKADSFSLVTFVRAGTDHACRRRTATKWALNAVAVESGADTAHAAHHDGTQVTERQVSDATAIPEN